MTSPYNILISVIVPNYNHASFIEKRLESIFAQSYDNYELILLDDASSDGSGDILKKYESHPKVSHLLINESNSGSPVSQWKRGLGYAKGEFIWIAESDDYASPEFLAILVEDALASDADIVYCNSMIVDEGGIICDEVDYSCELFDNSRWTHCFIGDGREEIDRYLIYKNTIHNVSATILKRKSMEAAVDSGLDYLGIGDWAVYISMLKNGKVSFNNSSLNYFRYHSGTTRNFNEATFNRSITEAQCLYDRLLADRIVSFKQYSEVNARLRRFERGAKNLDGYIDAFLSWGADKEVILLWAYNRMSKAFIDELFRLANVDRIVAIVDRRSSGKEWRYRGVRIVTKEELENLPAKLNVLVVSMSFSDSILKDIKRSTLECQAIYKLCDGKIVKV